MLVREVFSSLQGEGPSVGTPATFIRLGGCNLACWFCDTDFEEARSIERDAVDLVAEASKHGHDLVVVTGGEPLRQNIAQLVRGLRDAGHFVEIETSGSMMPRGLDIGTARLIVSPKTPSLAPGIEALAAAWKYLVGTDTQLDESDGLPIADFQNTGTTRPLARPPAHLRRDLIFIQPIAIDSPLAAAGRCAELCRRYGYRLSLQTHKLLGIR